MEDKILRALKKVIDPELGINIVDLGLIYKVGQKDGVANILMTLTSPGCPLAGTFREQVMDVVMKTKEVKKVKVKVGVGDLLLTFCKPLMCHFDISIYRND